MFCTLLFYFLLVGKFCTEEYTDNLIQAFPCAWRVSTFFVLSQLSWPLIFDTSFYCDLVKSTLHWICIGSCENACPWLFTFLFQTSDVSLQLIFLSKCSTSLFPFLSFLLSVSPFPPPLVFPGIPIMQISFILMVLVHFAVCFKFISLLYFSPPGCFQWPVWHDILHVCLWFFVLHFLFCSL